jgi:hypothetical protein
MLSRFSHGLRAGRPGFDSRQGKIFVISSAFRQALGPISLLSNGYLGLFLRWYGGRGVKMNTLLPLVPRSRMVELTSNTPYVFMALKNHRAGWCKGNIVLFGRNRVESRPVYWLSWLAYFVDFSLSERISGKHPETDHDCRQPNPHFLIIHDSLPIPTDVT